MIFKIADMTDLGDCNSHFLYEQLQKCEQWLREHGEEVPG